MTDIDLRHGRWQDALADITECDVVIADPPYTKRNKAGFRSGAQFRRKVRGEYVPPPSYVWPTPPDRYVIPYDAIAEEDAIELATWIASVAKYWAIVFNDHVGFRWLESAFQDLGWFVFAPVAWTKRNPVPRMAADGPTCAVEHIMVARPKKMLPKDRRGSRPGWYECPVEVWQARCDAKVVGSKPIALMSAILGDYTLPGDLVVDPYAGSGTTLVAAHRMGRRAIGSEVDSERHRSAASRCLAESRQQRLFE